MKSEYVISMKHKGLKKCYWTGKEFAYEIQKAKRWEEATNAKCECEKIGYPRLTKIEAIIK